MAQERSPDGTDSEAAEHEEEEDAKHKEGDEEDKQEHEQEEVALNNNRGRRKQVTEGTDKPTAPGKPPMSKRASGPLPKIQKAVPKDQAPSDKRIPRKTRPKP